jgi:hypothetical protein
MDAGATEEVISKLANVKISKWNTELSASVNKTAHAKHSRELYFICTFSNFHIFTFVLVCSEIIVRFA